MKLIFIKLHLFKIMSQLPIWLDIKIKNVFKKQCESCESVIKKQRDKDFNFILFL